MACSLHIFTCYMVLVRLRGQPSPSSLECNWEIKSPCFMKLNLFCWLLHLNYLKKTMDDYISSSLLVCALRDMLMKMHMRFIKPSCWFFTSRNSNGLKFEILGNYLAFYLKQTSLPTTEQYLQQRIDFPCSSGIHFLNYLFSRITSVMYFILINLGRTYSQHTILYSLINIEYCPWCIQQDIIKALNEIHVVNL